MSTADPRLYSDLMLHLAQYLNAEHGFPNPLEEQGDPLGVYISGWVDQPDTALTLVGPWEYERDSDTVPAMRFLVAHRAPSLPEVGELQRRVFTALQHPERFDLTATVQLRYCARVISDPPVPDLNNRKVVVDTYECRAYRDTNDLGE